MPPWWPMSGLDLIPDADTALKIGRIILDRYYGEHTTACFEPYHAALRGDEWSIGGTHKSGGEHPGLVIRGGGQPGLRLSKKDARVIHIALSR